MTATITLPAFPIVCPPGRSRFYDEQAFGNSGVIIADPCQFLQVFVMNKGASTLYLQFFDSATVPADATVPTFIPVPVAAGALVQFCPGQGLAQYVLGFPMANGLSWAASTTAGTKTVDSTSSLWVSAQFI